MTTSARGEPWKRTIPPIVLSSRPDQCADDNVLGLLEPTTPVASDPRGGNVDLRQAFGFETCGDADDGICCHKGDSLPIEETAEEEGFCEDVPGYQCVSQTRCRGGHVLVDGDGGEERPFLSVGVGGEVDLKSGGVDLRQAEFPEIVIDHSRSKCKGSLEVCCQIDDVDPVVEKKNEAQYESSCGKHNTNGVGVRIQSAESTQVTKSVQYI